MDRFERFSTFLLPIFKEHFGENYVRSNEAAKNISFRSDKNGPLKKGILTYYPKGNLVDTGTGRWVREDSFRFLLNELFHEERSDLYELMHPMGVLPKVKQANVSSKNKKINETSDVLSIVGDKFSYQNLSKKTFAVKTIEKALDRIGLPYIMEYPIVVKKSAQNSGAPKLYLADFYIPPPFKLIIEVDGGYHNEESRIQYDDQRDRSVSAKGTGNTIRIKNEDALRKDFDLLSFLKTQNSYRLAIKSFKDQLSIQKETILK